MDSTKAEFQAIFDELAEELKTHLASKGFPPDIIAHVYHCFIANIQGGKLHRGLAVLYAGRSLIDRPFTAEESKQLSILGWLVEIFQGLYLIWDDIMDESTTRRGQLCWYRQPAVDDAALLKSTIFLLLKNFIDLFLKAGFETELGQLCDVAASKEKHVVENFSKERYFFLVEHKSTYYSPYLPLALALEYWGLTTARNTQQIHTFATILGEYFQVHDDYIDVFGDPTVSGKIGTDIQDNKCTWFINEAFIRSNEVQKEELRANYGNKNIECIAKVKAIFLELELEQTYLEYEEAQREKIERVIAGIDESEGLKRETFSILFKGFRKGR